MQGFRCRMSWQKKEEPGSEPFSVKVSESLKMKNRESQQWRSEKHGMCHVRQLIKGMTAGGLTFHNDFS